jgi:hypothetical protein
MRKRALLIGCQTGALRGVHADVELMASLLESLGLAATTLVQAQATRDGIRDAYRGLIDDTAAGDAAVVYYSGHGARFKNPTAAQDPSEPKWLQYLCPTDIDDPSGGGFRGLLAEELSQLQWALTEKTDNVTTILDCCHAARMSRDPAALPKARERAGTFPWTAVRAAWQAVRATPLAGDARVDSNPSAIRIVACAPDESAFELETTAFGSPHGALTSTLVGLLRQPGSGALTWHQLIGLLRPAVIDLVPNQRPEVEGRAIDRYLFDTRERQATGVLTVLVDGGAAVIDGASLFGICEGDTYAIVAPGGDPEAPLAIAIVDSIVGARARLQLDGASPSDLPKGAEAHPREVALGRRPVAIVPAGGPHTGVVADALSRSPHLRVAATAEPVIATIRLDADGGMRLFDAQGEPFSATSRPVTDSVIDLLGMDLQQLARAAHLRNLASGTGEAKLDEEMALEYSLLTDDIEQPLARSGAHLFSGDQVVVRIHNRSAAKRYVSVFDVGLRGAITLLTTAEPAGIGIEPGGSYELYRLPATNALAGVELFWPDDLPAGLPRPETFVSIVTDQPQDLTRLRQGGVRTRGAARSGSSLQRLVEDIAAGVRDARPPEQPVSVVRYRIEHFDFYLHAEGRPGAEPDFEIDERPDPSFRLVVPRAAGPVPQRLAVRLKEIVVHSNHALRSASVRIDSLVVTRTTHADEPYRPSTHRFEGVRDGDRLPMDNLLLYEGPIRGFLDLAIWVSRDDTKGLDLAELFKQEATGTDVNGAVALLAGLAVAAPQATLVAGMVGAVAVLVRTSAALLEKATGKSIGVYRTSLLPHEQFGAGDPAARHPAEGLLRAQDMSFSYEIVDVT